MSRPRSQSLDVVRKLAERAEQQAARQVQAQQLHLRQEQAQLARVCEFQQDYLAQIHQQRSLPVQELMSYRNFVQHLSRSINQLQGKIDHIEKSVAKAREQWSRLRQRRVVLEDLIARARHDEALALDKLDQKALDELVNQCFQRRQGGEDEGSSIV